MVPPVVDACGENLAATEGAEESRVDDLGVRHQRQLRWVVYRTLAYTVWHR